MCLLWSGPVGDATRRRCSDPVARFLYPSGIGLANAKPVSLSLNPISGPSYACTSNDTAYLSGSADTASASCSMSDVGVNVYQATAAIGGDYFTGGGLGVVGVFNPALGFTTGGGFFILPDGTRVNFGFNAKTLKGG